MLGNYNNFILSEYNKLKLNLEIQVESDFCKILKLNCKDLEKQKKKNENNHLEKLNILTYENTKLKNDSEKMKLNNKKLTCENMKLNKDFEEFQIERTKLKDDFFRI